MWLYSLLYLALLAFCFIQSFYVIFMLAAMLFRECRLLYPFFHKVDINSKKHGGEIVAQVLKSHGIQNIFTLPGEHVSPITVTADKLKIEVVEVRHEANAVLAAAASARLTGIPGVAVVTVGSELTKTVTAIRNVQLSELPVVVVVVAAPTMFRSRGSLQDIDQKSLLKSASKKCFPIDCVRDICSTLREAFRMSQIGVPGPVFVELPVDILYSYPTISQQLASHVKSSSNLKSKLVKAYADYSLRCIFAGAWKDRDFDPLPVTVCSPMHSEVEEVIKLLSNSTRPLLIVGSQAILRPHGPDQVAENIRRLKVPVYLNGSACGLLGSNYELQFRHAWKEAVEGADCVLLLGAICDFRLSYGRIFKRSTKVISINRSLGAAKLNAGVVWQPTVAIESDIGKFFISLIRQMSGKLPLNVDKRWVDYLKQREHYSAVKINSLKLDPDKSYLLQQ